MNCSTIKAADGSSYRLSKREKEWLTASSDKPAALLCIRYALVYTRRDPKWLLDECSQDVKYSTQIVDTVHSGLDKVREIYESRVVDHAWYPASGYLPLIELDTMPDGRPCGVLFQPRGRFDNGIGRPYFWMTFVCGADGKAVNMYSGCFPSSLTLKGSGIFPGIPAARLKKEKARKPDVLPAGVPLRILYIHNRHDPDWLKSAEAVKDVLPFFNMSRLDIVPIDYDTEVEADAVWLLNQEILALPHLHIISCGESIVQLDGPFIRDRLMNEIYLRFWPPGGTNVEPGIVRDLLAEVEPGMGVAYKIQRNYYCDPESMKEIMAAFQGDNPLAASRAAYVLDRLSAIKKDVIQPYKQVLLDTKDDDPNFAKLRHVARMLTRLTLTGSEVQNAEQLLLNLAWQKKDAALQVFALKSIRYFAKTNFLLREYAGPFVFELMRHTRNGRVVREAEITLDTIEYFDEKVHEQWARQIAHA